MPYTVSHANPIDDRTTVLGLWQENLPEAAPGRYRWLYEAGPGTGWLVQADDGAAVGSTGRMGRRLKLFDTMVDAGQAVDLNVAAGHRAVGPALALQRAVTAAVGRAECRLLYAIPNKNSEPVLRRIGYRLLGPLTRWARPLRLGEELRARLSHPLARRLLPPLANPLLSLTAPERFRRLPKGYRTEMIAEYDVRFDRLWRRAQQQFPIIGQRTAEYLTWRFARSPEASYRTLALVQPDGELAAYAVYHHRDAMAEIADVLFDTPWHLDRLLAALLRRARRERIEAVTMTYLGSETVGQSLRRLGFRQRPGTLNVLLYVHKHETELPLDRLFDPAEWHLTQADVDTVV